MSEETVDMGGGDVAEPVLAMPHETMAPGYEAPQVTESIEPQDTPMMEIAENDPYRELKADGSYDINIPEDPEEFDAFMDSLSKEERADFQKNVVLEDNDIETEAAQPGDNTGDQELSEDSEEQTELTHEISQDEYDKLPETSKVYLDGMKTRLDALAEFENPDYQAGLKAALEDPVISSRIRQLQGQENPADIESEYLSDKSIKDLKIDMDFDARGSAKRLKQHINSAVMNAVSQVHDSYKQQDAQRSYNGKLENEFRSIQDLDANLKSELAFNDPSHPMAGFTKWLVENRDNINVVSMGGVDTYKLYMSKTGQEVHETPTEIRKAVVRNVAKAKSQHARTLPRSIKSQANSESKMAHGVDIERFKTDDAYMQSVYDQHSGDMNMIRVLNRWSFE